MVKNMFFRRERPKQLAFQDRVAALKQAGFTVEPDQAGGLRIARGDCATVIQESGTGVRVTRRAGILIQGEVSSLVDGGFQKFFRTPAGRRRPALASDLRMLHDFEEDFKEALGLVSLYNESLGTVSTMYLYDRVKDRDSGVPKRAWES